MFVSAAMPNGDDEIRTGKPVCLVEIGGGRFGGVVGVGVEEADDIKTAIAALFLRRDEIFGGDLVAVGPVGIGTVAASHNGLDFAYAVAHATQQYTAPFARVRSFGGTADRVEVGRLYTEHAEQNTWWHGPKAEGLFFCRAFTRMKPGAPAGRDCASFVEVATESWD